MRALLLGLLLLVAQPGAAEPARVTAADVRPTAVTLSLSRAVPWRAYTLDAPRRLVVEMEGAAWGGTSPPTLPGAQMGAVAGGWLRLVMPLGAPLLIREAALDTAAPEPRLSLRLGPASAEDFVAASRAPPEARLPAPVLAAPPPREDGRLRVVLDPGHGGIDTGAVQDGLAEAPLMLDFAGELRAVLEAEGALVVLTREDDVFLPLEARISVARAAGADAFLSLHADKLPEGAGQAEGATLYTLSEAASDAASALLAERHDGADLMAGVDLSGQGDEIAMVLMDMARVETRPRTDRLARHLARTIAEGAGPMNRRPLRSAAFSVLKSPDIPSILIELGFLSSAADRARLADPEWRARMARAIGAGLLDWAEEDARLRSDR